MTGRRPREKGYGLNVLPPLTAVAELAGIVAMLLVIDWLWPSLDINSLQPSPYWLPVLLLSLQYGTASGSLAVVVAIAAYFAFVTLPEQGVGENEFAYRLRILAQPILWIATAVLLGQFRMVQISAKRELVRRVEELEAQGRTLADYAGRLRERCDALERDIASRALPADARLLAELAGLRGPPADLAAAVTRCLDAALPGAAASVHVRQGSSLYRLCASGWPTDAHWLATLPGDHPLVDAVMGAKRRLSILEAGDETALAGQGLAAVPIIDPRSGRALGILKLEFCSAGALTPSLTRQLEALALAIAAGLDGSSSIVNPVRVAGEGEQAAPIPLRQPSRLGVVSVIEPAATASDAAPLRDAAQPAELARPKVGY